MSITVEATEKEPIKCSECGSTEGPIFRCPDDKDRCVKCASRYVPDNKLYE